MSTTLSRRRLVRLHPHRVGCATISGDFHATYDWFRRTLDDEDLWFFARGRGYAKFRDGREFEVRRGSVLFLKRGDELEFFHDGHDEALLTYYFHFDLLPSSSRKASIRLPQFLELTDCLFYEVAFKRILSLIQGRSGLYGTACEGMPPAAEDLFEQTLQQMEFDHDQRIDLLAGSPTDASTNASANSMERHYRQTVLELVSRIYQNPEFYWNSEEMLNNTGYCRAHLSRIWKRITGKTITETLIEARLEKAYCLLRNTNLSITQISGEIGYESPFYFCRQFKKSAGITPSQYRSRLLS